MQGGELLEYIRQDFIGLDTSYPLADGRVTRRHYLDSAASTLMMRSAQQVVREFLPHYANTHSQLHFSARIATETYRWAHEQVLRFVHADSERYTCFFAGSGSTAGFNQLARSLAARRPEREVVLVSQMEHHSNDLPHRKYAGRVVHIPFEGEPPATGQIDLSALERLLKEHDGQVNYIAVTAASNVTGIINPIQDIAELAHAFDAWIVVDASQLIAHAPLRVCHPLHPEGEVDFLVFSGHKVYAPGSPGVVVARRTLLEDQDPEEVGGGMVDEVYLQRYKVASAFPDRQEAGTPNIVGSVLLAAVLEVLQRVGMQTVHQEETRLLHKALHALSQISGVRLYGCTDLERTPRTGTIAFNLEGLDHGLVAAALNDYHNVAVRNECFCAHPYVREMLKPELWALDLDPDADDALDLIKLKQGMVRASFGLYTTDVDIDALIDGIKELLARRDYYRAHYQGDTGGNYRHKTFFVPGRALFDPLATLDRVLDDRHQRLNVAGPIKPQPASRVSS